MALLPYPDFEPPPFTSYLVPDHIEAGERPSEPRHMERPGLEGAWGTRVPRLILDFETYEDPQSSGVARAKTSSLL